MLALMEALQVTVKVFKNFSGFQEIVADQQSTVLFWIDIWLKVKGMIQYDMMIFYFGHFKGERWLKLM